MHVRSTSVCARGGDEAAEAAVQLPRILIMVTLKKREDGGIEARIDASVSENVNVNANASAGGSAHVGGSGMGGGRKVGRLAIIHDFERAGKEHG